MSEYPGGDTVGVITSVPSGGKDALGGQPVTETVVWVYGCVFGTQHTTEEQDETITSAERAWVWFPYVDGIGIPTVDTTGAPIVDPDGNPVTVMIDNSCWLRPKRDNPMGTRDYKVFGMPSIEYDLDGRPDHVWVTAEWRAG